MKTYALIAITVALLILVSFGVVEAMGFEPLTDPSGLMTQGGLIAAAVGGGLLIADIFIPVPSSVLMIFHGALFGILPGFLWSLISVLGGAMIGWWMGKQSHPWVNRWVSSADQQTARKFMEKHGIFAIVLSRMLPILSETVSIMSGVVKLNASRFFWAALLGSIPPALIYAIAGAVTTDLASGALIALCVFVIAGLSWWISLRIIRNQSAESKSTAPSSASSGSEPNSGR